LHKFIIVLVITLFLCSCVKAPILDENIIAPSPSSVTEKATPLPQNGDPSPAPSGAGLSLSLEERMASLAFMPVSGQYVRNSIQDGVGYTEIFALDKSSFVRAALNETEEEVFAYDYAQDRFTYMYLFEGELLSKVVYDMKSGSVLEDEDDLAEFVIDYAQELKDYFYKLLDKAGIGVEELM